jgi:hypothetical protein
MTVAAHALGTQPPVDDLAACDQETASGFIGHRGLLGISWNISDGVTAFADQVVMLCGDVRVVTLGPVHDIHYDQFAHGHQLVQGVVDGGPADLRQLLTGEVMHLLRSQMHVFSYQHLGYGPSLSAEAP